MGGKHVPRGGGDWSSTPGADLWHSRCGTADADFRMKYFYVMWTYVMHCDSTIRQCINGIVAVASIHHAT